MVRTRTLAALVGALALVATALFTTASPAAADDEFFCPFADDSDIQAAIDTSSPGDTITIWGSCEATLVVPTGKDIRIIGAGPLGATLDADGAGTVLTVEPGATAILDNLTITGGWTNGSDDAGGILVLGHVRAADLRVIGNTATNGSSDVGGILVNTTTADASLILVDSLVADNGGGAETGGIRVGEDDHEAHAELIGVTTRHNTGVDAGGLRVTSGATAELTRVTAASNTATAGGTGPGIRITGGSSVTGSQITVTGNRGTHQGDGSSAGGLYVTGGADVSLSDVTVTANRIARTGVVNQSSGGGIAITGGADVTIDGLTVAFNRVTGTAPDSFGAGGARVGGGSTFTATDALFVLNTGPEAGGVGVAGNAEFFGADAVVMLNIATSGTGGVALDGGDFADVQLSAFNLFGNCSGFSDPGCL